MMDAMIIPAAVMLDLLVGDPRFALHPVRLIGNLIGIIERACRTITGDGYCSGLLCTFISLLTVSPFVTGIVIAAEAFDHRIALALSCVLIYFCISAKDLWRHAMDVSRRLSENDLHGARERVSMIVGRDTNILNEHGVVRACVESVAENSVDGIISPIMFAALGFYLFDLSGAVAVAYLFKTASTLDSMIGYKNEKYLRFGWSAARFDDVLNYIPARIGLLLISLAAIPLRQSFVGALKIGWRDSGHHSSPNSGYPEAAFAGALRVRIGGPTCYKGVWADYPYIGEDTVTLAVDTIYKSCMLMLFSTILTCASCTAIVSLLK
ncbi:MAG: cobalamin biosynthesis protein CobD [Planctomycetes bacterium]|nr:cobalamin biosynthesis protein CobD [Planctomycetota bacterium]